jgi:hypothetical protein
VETAAGGGLVVHAGMLGQEGVALAILQGPTVGPEDSSQLDMPAERLKEHSHGRASLPGLARHPLATTGNGGR